MISALLLKSSRSCNEPLQGWRSDFILFTGTCQGVVKRSRHCLLIQWVSFVSISQILDEIAEHGIKIYQLPDADSDEDEEFKEQTRVLKVRVWRQTDALSDILPVLVWWLLGRRLLLDVFVFHISFHALSLICCLLGIHSPLSNFSRQAFPLLWLAPTSWLR